MRLPSGMSALLRLLAVLTLLTLLVAPAVPPRTAAAEPGSGSFVQIRIDKVTPDVVSTTSDPVVTVAGTVTNIGDRPVRDVMVRLEHAAAVTASAGLRTNLAGGVEQFEAVSDFITIAPELQQGQRVPFTLSYPVHSTDLPSLNIEQPGIYPALVNVNGTPDYGAPARLDDARFLLPVLGVPRDPSVVGGDAITAVTPPDTSRPVRTTVLWPLADKPRLAAGLPGATNPVRLADDDLAASLAKGGRLDTLLGAAEFATSDPVDPGGQVRSSLCLAVDPDLLVTVNGMTLGYVVNDNAFGGINSPTHPGTGQSTAAEWLNRLKALAQRVCVVPTIYSQADLGAVQRVADPGLTATAVNEPADIVDQILGTTTVRGATLLGDGALTAPVVGMLANLNPKGQTVAIAAGEITPQDSADGAIPPVDVTPRRYAPNVVAAPFDPALGAALAGVGTEPAAPSYLGNELAVPVRQDSDVARRQDALAALLWRGLRPGSEPRTQIVMPPMTWNLSAEDAQAMLTTVATAIHSGLAAPRPLTAVIAETGALPPAVASPPQTEPAGNPNARFSDGVIGSIGGTTSRLWGLTSALTVDERTGLSGPQYTAPLREDMLRALSQSVPQDARNGLAELRVRTVANTVDDLFRAVTVVNPGGSYTLATERSPLPLALRNDLPVPIRVRLDIDAPPGMTVDDMGEIELPPGYLPLRVPIEVHFTQRVAVDVALRTAAGLPLGEPVRLSVHSNAYGKVLFFITLAGGAILALLVGRRLWHRFRGQPDRADLDRPSRRPDPVDTALAHTPDEP
jgi:hypothetical protein